MSKVGENCPSCKKRIDFKIDSFDEKGNFICASCLLVIFPVTEEDFLNIKDKLPVQEIYYSSMSAINSYYKKEFVLQPINESK